MRKGLLLVLSGPSGVGKGTVCGALLSKNAALKLSVSVTTRQPRLGELEGVHYFFKTEQEFNRLVQSQQLLEYAFIFNKAYYGTPRKYVEEQIETGNNVVLEIDVQGAMQVKKNYPDAVTIFIVPPSFETLAKRLYGRGTEDDATVRARLETAHKELMMMDDYDYVVVNDLLDLAVSQIGNIIIAESLKVERNRDLLDLWNVGGKAI